MNKRQAKQVVWRLALSAFEDSMAFMFAKGGQADDRLDTAIQEVKAEMARRGHVSTTKRKEA